jgi:prepilin-type N-terminal cleavage/methylation domain-containing protein
MRPSPERSGSEAGFTLVEFLVAMVIGLVVLTASTSLAISSWRGLAGVELRDGLDRNARFMGTSLHRDLQEAGVDLASLPGFGSLMVSNDTLSILRVPYEPAQAIPYSLSIANFATGVCGATCVEIETGGVAPLLVAGDLAQLHANTQRRLILITGVNPAAGGYRIQFTGADSLLGRPAGLGGLVINPAATFVQKVAAATYWLEGDHLMRAERLAVTGAPQGEVMATAVQAFDVSLVFTDGDEASTADPNDVDASNDYDDLAAVRVRAVLQADRTDPRVNRGTLLTRAKEWYVVPRNLIYERNRL